MGLRCKPGDLAVVIASDDADDAVNIGVFVTVVGLCLDAPYPDCWLFRDASRPIRCEDSGDVSWVLESDGDPAWICWIRDCELQPIRPGCTADSTPASIPAEPVAA